MATVRPESSPACGGAFCAADRDFSGFMPLHTANRLDSEDLTDSIFFM
jgi:hypothetical protein